MIDKLYSLPSFPVEKDVWTVLSEEKRPIMVYGMGNGADKLFDKFAELNIKVSEIFASDGFVRGHSFRGYKVRSFSEIKENYKDFVIVLSFASNRDEVISMLSEIDDSYDMFVPDMPIAAVGEYFDKSFYNDHYDEIVKAYHSLCDEESRRIFSSVVNYKLSGKMKDVISAFSTKEEMYSLLPVEKIRVCVDAGAYNGDTLREMRNYFPVLEKAYAIEPDKKTFKRLLKYVDGNTGIEIVSVNAAVWNEDSDGILFGSGNRNSTAVATASFRHSEDAVKMVKIDSLVQESVDYLKYDVEGAEYEALEGSKEIILRDRPAMLISVYHRSRDIFELVNYVREKYPCYNLYLRRLKCLPAWEINLIAVKKSERN